MHNFLNQIIIFLIKLYIIEVLVNDLPLTFFSSLWICLSYFVQYKLTKYNYDFLYIAYLYL